MSRKVVVSSSQSEFNRLKIRASKYIDFALTHKKKSKQLIQSTALFIEGERTRAVEDYKATHSRTYPQPLTRWMHFKKAVCK